mmetsp:Transcript_20964/g.71458  ORF Transcript_20964/g.71458 Transcript_20964/m.71458 type:complete len:521 (-) Transcript_20964:136-1698(-)
MEHPALPGKKMVVYEEEGWAHTTASGLKQYVAIRSYERWPHIKVHEVSNGTHMVNFQVYEGSSYHFQGPIAMEERDSDESAPNLEYVDRTTVRVVGVDGTSSVELEARAFELTDPAVPGLKSTFYADVDDVDVPVALHLEPTDGNGEHVITEFLSYEPGAEYNASMYDLEALAAAARSSEDYIVPPSILGDYIGNEVVGRNSRWGRKLTAEEIAARAAKFSNLTAGFNSTSAAAGRRRLLRRLMASDNDGGGSGLFEVIDGGCGMSFEAGNFGLEFLKGPNSVSDTGEECEGPYLAASGSMFFAPILDLTGTLAIEWDKEEGDFSVEGCLSASFPCEKAFKTLGMAKLGKKVCSLFFIEGEVCASYTTSVDAECADGMVTATEEYMQKYCTKYGGRRNRRCKDWEKQTAWREVQLPNMKPVPLDYRVGATGSIKIGYDMKFISIITTAQIDLYYATSSTGFPDGTSADGMQLAIRGEFSVKLLSLRWVKGFSFVPWKGGNKCSDHNLAIDGIDHKLLGER